MRIFQDLEGSPYPSNFLVFAFLHSLDHGQTLRRICEISKVDKIMLKRNTYIRIAVTKCSKVNCK
jgi:hypothetical protein